MEGVFSQIILKHIKYILVFVILIHETYFASSCVVLQFPTVFTLSIIYQTSLRFPKAGLPPNMDKNLYVTVAKTVKAALPHIHLHAFSPEEIIYGAKKNKISFVYQYHEHKNIFNMFENNLRKDAFHYIKSKLNIFLCS